MVLFKASKRMFHKGTDRENIREDDCEGFVKTEYKTVILGCATGIKFVAKLETESGTAIVAFFIPEDELNFDGADAEYESMDLGTIKSASQKSQDAWLN